MDKGGSLRIRTEANTISTRQVLGGNHEEITKDSVDNDRRRDTPGSPGTTLLVANREDPVLCLMTQDGRNRKFSLKGMYHLEHLIATLKEAGIAVDPQLELPEE